MNKANHLDGEFVMSRRSALTRMAGIGMLGLSDPAFVSIVGNPSQLTYPVIALDYLNTYTPGSPCFVFNAGENPGIGWQFPWGLIFFPTALNAPTVASDTFDAYTVGESVSNANGGSGWSGTWSPFVDIASDTFNSYTPGDGISGLSGGTSGWSAAWAVG